MTAPSLLVVSMRDDHADEVLWIYAAGIVTGHATFEPVVPSWAEFRAAHLPDHSYVAVEGGKVVGWIAARQVSPRPAYSGVIEHSVYVDIDHQRCGIGQALVRTLLRGADDAGIWTVQTGVFPENTASLTLHEKAGFRIVGVRERIGRVHGVWRDVVLLERRSGRN